MGRLPDKGTWFGKLLRLPLRLLPRESRVRIVKGPAKGFRWIVGASTHGYWLGSYEMEKARLFARSIPPDGVVYDIGAHVGYYSLIAARAVGPGGSVVAFEPDARNLRFLKAHVSTNNLDHIEVVGAAVGVSTRSGASFLVGDHPATGRLDDLGTQPVEVVSLDDFVTGRDRGPDILKIDIEGGEVEALRGARSLLTRYHPLIFLATHGSDAERLSLETLTDAGYGVEKLDVDEYLARPREGAGSD